MHQKKLALVNDVTGYGRCSIAVALPIVSALKVQGCILPTAILSVHTGFHDYYLDDYTDHMVPYIESWKKNGLTFDGISTGFLGSARQIDIVLDFLRLRRLLRNLRKLYAPHGFRLFFRHSLRLRLLFRLLFLRFLLRLLFFRLRFWLCRFRFLF
mgnify:CR=1 FL=1